MTTGAPVPDFAQYGALGAALVALVGSLIWFLRVTTTRLLDIIQANTAALVKLEGALQGKIVYCPVLERLGREQGRAAAVVDPRRGIPEV